MEIWRICLLFYGLGSASGTIQDYFRIVSSLAQIGCLEHTIPDYSLISNHNDTELDAKYCDTLFSANFKDIPIFIAGRIYYTAVRWDPAKGVFNAETFLHDIPKEQTNNTILLILQNVNSFALEFESCQVGGKREYRIHLQVVISGNRINIDAAVNKNGAFAEAGITVLDVYSAKVVVQVTWPEWSDLALVVTGRIVAWGKNGGYISSLGHVVKLAGDVPKAFVAEIQTFLKSSSRCLAILQESLQAKQKAVKSAHSVFDDGVAKLEVAKQYLEEKKQDLQTKRKELKNKQEDIDVICEIRQCRLICIPGIKSDTCALGSWRFKCFRMTNCMFEMEDPKCIIENVWCRTQRRAASVALTVAHGTIRVADLALDGAKSAVGAAQVIVDKSRVVLDVAILGLETAEMSIEALKFMIEKADNGLDALQYLIDDGVNAVSLITEGVSENVIDVRNCGLSLSSYSKEVLESGIELHCEVNLRGRGFERVSRSLHLGDFF